MPVAPAADVRLNFSFVSDSLSSTLPFRGARYARNEHIMRFPSCLSSDSIDRTRPEYSSLAQTSSHRSSTASSRVPGCIFCDVSKDRGFGVVYENEELIAFHDR
jgi:hypothetical protein